MVESVTRAKIVFFDSNPVGRIMTKFSKDILVMDQIVGFLMLFISYGLGRAFTVTVMLCAVNYWMIIPVVFAVVSLLMVYKRAAPALGETMIMDGVVRGPIH
jgi:ATP-binding cassette subfamily C (CFTR/MRP) protein 4